MASDPNFYKGLKLRDNPSNWHLYIYQLEIVLEALDLKIVCVESADQDQDENKTELKAKKSKAMMLIATSIDENLMPLLLGCKTPYQQLTRLKNHHVKKGAEQAVRLDATIRNKKFKTGNLQDHLNSMRILKEELEAAGKPLTDLDFATIILASLPESYDLTKRILLSQDIESLTYNKVEQQLLLEEQRIHSKIDEIKSETEDLLFTKSQVKCHSCRQFGHYASKCPSKAIPIKSGHLRTKQPGKWCSFHKTSTHTNSECRYLKNKKTESSNVAPTETDKEFLLTTYTDKKSSNWIVDSGASKHMTFNKSIFTSMTPVEITVHVANGETLTARGVGNAKIMANGNIVTLQDCLYIPEISFNLLSVPAMKNRATTIFNRTGFTIQVGKSKIHGYLRGNLYILEAKTIPEFANVAAPIDINTLHSQLGHPGEEALRKTAQAYKIITTGSLNQCEACIKGKMKRTPFPTSTSITEGPGDIISSDILGPINPLSHSKFKYIVNFVDHHTRMTTIYFMKSKDEVLTKFKEYHRYIETNWKVTLRTLRSDNGGEYMSNKFKNYLSNAGIKHETTIPHTPQQNGVAERNWRLLMERVRILLLTSDLPKSFWAEAARTACYILNRTFSVSLGDIPILKLTGKMPSMNFYTFGTKCWVKNTSITGKLDVRAINAIYLGPAETSKAHRVYLPSTKNVILTRDIVLQKESFYDIPTVHSSDSDDSQIQQLEDEPTQLSEITSVQSADEESKEIPKEQTIELRVKDKTNPTTARRSTRITAKPARYADEFANMITDDETPKTFKEATNGPDSDLWKESMHSEMNSLIENKTWEIIDETDVPQSKTVLGCKWIYRIKNFPERKLKSRLVAQGFKQQEDIDYTNTFSPVLNMDSLRLITAWSVQNNRTLNQLDVLTAYLNGYLDSDLYMKMPEGFELPGKVCKLYKSIYGLKQSDRCWNLELHEGLLSIGYIQSVNDPCLYIHTTLDSVIGVYVDDILDSCDTEETATKVKALFESKWKINYIGKASQVIGLQFYQTGESLLLHQSNLAQKILEKTKMTEAYPSTTPMEINYQPSEKPITTFEYRSLLGSLFYLLNTRPDIAFALTRVSRCEDWAAIKRILRYIKGTISNGIKFTRNNEETTTLTGYADSDWANDISTRRSTTGFIFFLAGGPIAWKSKLQSTVALSSTEAEYMSLSYAARHGIFLLRILQELGINQKSLSIAQDNQGAIKLAVNKGVTPRSKHIDVQHHFVREKIQSGEIELTYVPTNDMKADFLTKALTPVKNSKGIKQIIFGTTGGVNKAASLSDSTTALVLRSSHISH